MAAGEEEELRLSAHTLLLPTRGQLEARMMVTAFEMGLDNLTEDAVSSMVCALEVCVLISRRGFSGEIGVCVWNDARNEGGGLYYEANSV